jgi:AraC family transcriptional regulator, positive regulator of tynA and feaB
MQTWSTEDIERRRALAYWVDTVGQALLELEIEAAAPERFSASLQQSRLGPAEVNLVDASEQWMRRTHAGIARSRSPSIRLLQLRAGQFDLQQYGRECRIQAGDAVLIDSEEPYRLSCQGHTVCLSVAFPQPWLSKWLPSAQQQVACRLSRHAWGAVLARALACLDPTKIGQLALPGDLVADQIASLLVLAVGAHPSDDASEPGMLERLRGTLRERYFEGDLSPTAVAAQHGIGKRHLHFLFAKQGTTFSAELMAIRLERARQVLHDRRFERVPVGEIAMRCGFTDPSHFARRFRMRFRAAPAAYRKQATPETVHD